MPEVNQDLLGKSIESLIMMSRSLSPSKSKVSIVAGKAADPASLPFPDMAKMATPTNKRQDKIKEI